jgi:hypothetical protein
MSRETSRRWWYFIIGILALMVAGQAIHWFITPGSITASSYGVLRALVGGSGSSGA